MVAKDLDAYPLRTFRYTDASKLDGYDAIRNDGPWPAISRVTIATKPPCRWVVAGVVSWGIGCGERLQPGVMVRVSEFTGWIRQHVT